MKPQTMKVPALSQLYQHKQDYEAHRKKLQQIKMDRKTHLAQETAKDNYGRRQLTNFTRKNTTKSM